MDPFIGMGLISGLGSLFGSALGFGSQQMTNAQSMELAEYQYQKNLEMWNRQNEYNAPTAQMQRLKDAGLNPNLVYGNGSVGNASSEPPKYQAPTLGAYTNFGDLGVGSGMDAYLRSEYQKAEILNKNVDTEGKKLNNNRTEFEIAMQGIEESSRLYDLALKIGNVELQDLAKQKEEASIDLIRTNIVDVESQIDYRDFVQTPNTQSSTDKNKAETDYIRGPKTALTYAQRSVAVANAANISWMTERSQAMFAHELQGLINDNVIDEKTIVKLDNDIKSFAAKLYHLRLENASLLLENQIKYWHLHYGLPIEAGTKLVNAIFDSVSKSLKVLN